MYVDYGHCDGKYLETHGKYVLFWGVFGGETHVWAMRGGEAEYALCGKGHGHEKLAEMAKRGIDDA